ncbi:MAG: DUF4124 domain-containing protein [Agarilytica sp.]
MKTLLLIFGYTIWLLAPSLAAQDVYKTLTKEGKVVFSDTPQQNSEKIETELTNLQSPTQVSPQQRTSKTAKSSEYNLRLTSPKNGAKLGPSQRALALSISVTPALDAGYQVEFWLDGKRIRGPSRSTSASYPMGIKMRGKHSVMAKIVNSAGKAIASSTSSTIYVIRPN